MALEWYEINLGVKAALTDHLGDMLTTYEGLTGLTLPRPAPQNITFGADALGRMPVAVPTIWTRCAIASPGAAPGDRPIRNAPQAAHQYQTMPLYVRAFLPVMKGQHELSESVVAIYGEAMRRVLEYRLKEGNVHAVYFESFDPAPAPITNDGASGVIRECELVLRLDFRTQRHHLTP